MMLMILRVGCRVLPVAVQVVNMEEIPDDARESHVLTSRMDFVVVVFVTNGSKTYYSMS